MHQLPPLGALRAFEAAARHLSFKAAASELGVTPTAISHQVRILEEWLGHRLFDRHTRRVTLTRDGRFLATPLREGFEAFARAIAEIRSSRNRPTVTLTATTAFTAHWLIPRLGGIGGEVEIRLLARDEPVDMAAGAADLAVRYGWGPYPDLETELLVADSFVPVASPAVAVADMAAIAEARLIHFDWRRPLRAAPDWNQWFAAAGLDRAAAKSVGDVTFSEESHAIEAAIAGHGVALLSQTLTAGAIDRGLLCRLPGPVLAAPGFHLIWPRNRPLTTAADRTRRWLAAEAAISSSQVPEPTNPELRGATQE